MSDARCAHCGRARPAGDMRADVKAGWDIHDVPHGNGTVVTVAVCGRCRLTDGAPEEGHAPGTCSGTYKGEDAWIAECTEYDCDARWSCWDEACMEHWRDEHFDDDCECPNCYDGHHDAVIRQKPTKRKVAV